MEAPGSSLLVSIFFPNDAMRIIEISSKHITAFILSFELTQVTSPHAIPVLRKNFVPIT